MELTGKTILITGGGSGIGLELTKQLSALENTVIITGRSETKLERVKLIYGVETFVSDVTSAQNQSSLLSSISDQYGHLDLLINNAGIMNAYDFGTDEQTVSKVQAEIDVNATAPLLLTARALPLLRKGHEPAVLFVGSGVCYVAMPSTPVYTGTKALIHHAAQALRVQLKPEGIDVFEVLPPVVATDMAKALKSGNFKLMPPSELVRQIIQGLETGKHEMLVGQTRQIALMSRLFPKFLFRQFSKVEFH
ncbi:MAG: SDR family NAD(P)-dependent oxidoreductase [Cyanobacteria bacterium P01_F01_bin.3]